MTQTGGTPTTERSGWPEKAPTWLRRGVVYVLVGVAGLQVVEWMFLNLRAFLGLLFLAWLFAISLEPLVALLSRRGMRRGLATAAVMVGLLLLAAAFVAVFGALLVDQLGQLVRSLPDLVVAGVRWFNRSFGTSIQTSDIVNRLELSPLRIQRLAQELTPGVIGVVTSFVGLVFQGFTLLLFAYYMSAQQPALRRTVSSWFPPRHQRVISTVWEIAVAKTGGYVASRLVLAVLSAMFTGVFLWLLGVPFWLPLAIWTGVISQFIPTIGTYLAIAVPALIAMTNQPTDGIWVVVFGVGYQQVENYFFMPRITALTVSIHPAVAFGAVIAGAALFGAMGALVAIPVVAAIQALIETYGHRYELVSDTEPGEPSEPSEPGEPAEPVASAQPVEPVAPVAPGAPTIPTQPSATEAEPHRPDRSSDRL